MGEEMVTLVSPVGRPRLTRSIAAKGHLDLNGKTVLLIDNTKPKADVVLEEVAEAIQGHFPGAQLIRRRKPHQSRPSPFLEELAGEVDLAVIALAD